MSGTGLLGIKSIAGMSENILSDVPGEKTGRWFRQFLWSVADHKVSVATLILSVLLAVGWVVVVRYEISIFGAELPQLRWTNRDGEMRFFYIWRAYRNMLGVTDSLGMVEQEGMKTIGSPGLPVYPASVVDALDKINSYWKNDNWIGLLTNWAKCRQPFVAIPDTYGFPLLPKPSESTIRRFFPSVDQLRDLNEREELANIANSEPLSFPLLSRLNEAVETRLEARRRGQILLTFAIIFLLLMFIAFCQFLHVSSYRDRAGIIFLMLAVILLPLSIMDNSQQAGASRERTGMLQFFIYLSLAISCLLVRVNRRIYLIFFFMAYLIILPPFRRAVDDFNSDEKFVSTDEYHAIRANARMFLAALKSENKITASETAVMTVYIDKSEKISSH
ncbi:MAG: hypothetical protein HQM09_19055 [Candidatus Riflebacteria bacterium]|nr:hypothetical protein [Candidatus Riflebacteria bacterium]